MQKWSLSLSAAWLFWSSRWKNLSRLNFKSRRQGRMSSKWLGKWRCCKMSSNQSTANLKWSKRDLGTAQEQTKRWILAATTQEGLATQATNGQLTYHPESQTITKGPLLLHINDHFKSQLKGRIRIINHALSMFRYTLEISLAILKSLHWGQVLFARHLTQEYHSQEQMHRYLLQATDSVWIIKGIETQPETVDHAIAFPKSTLGIKWGKTQVNASSTVCTPKRIQASNVVPLGSQLVSLNLKWPGRHFLRRLDL